MTNPSRTESRRTSGKGFKFIQPGRANGHPIFLRQTQVVTRLLLHPSQPLLLTSAQVKQHGVFELDLF